MTQRELDLLESIKEIEHALRQMGANTDALNYRIGRLQAHMQSDRREG